ncbi:restriction endonuclease subunit S [uncultured Bacteroides sp.]|uniref:restriction endonuclease subunit S n=1 Tax=uncultured Bacteroides sp. TaxID=162156 RepID=UPI002613CB5E|nr:restriction endonuclease subunit S [uncultured Bacteroides sp.]
MKYEEYKDSGIEWIGEVPSHWEVRKIKTLSIVKRGASPRPIEDPKYFDENGEYAWVRIADVSNSERYLETTTQKLSKLGASLSVKREPGDIFISIAGTVGKPIITHIKCCIHDGFVWFPFLKQNSEFLYYIFMSGQPYLGLGKMGTQLNLNTETIGDIKIPIPPLIEQQAIATYLDEKCGEINRAIDVQKKKIDLLNELKQTIITDAVTKGLDPNAPMKDSGVEWIGQVPRHWEVRKIRTLSIVKRGASPRPIEDPKYFDENGEYAWVRIADVSSSERYLEETTQKLSKLGASLSIKREPGDIFISIAGTVGKPIITHIKCCIHDGFVWFPYLKQNTEFLYYIFMSGQPYLGLGKMGTQLNLNTETIGDIKVPIPGLQEQQNIVKFLDEECTKIDAQISKANRHIELLEELKQSIITEAVTGKIKVC